MKILFTIFSALIFIISCTPNHYTAYMNINEKDLCVNYLTAGKLNVNKDPMAQAIITREIDCTKYVDLARFELEKKQQSDWDTSSSRKKTVTCQQLGKFLTCF